MLRCATFARNFARNSARKSDISQSDTLKVVRNPDTLAPTQDTSVPSPGHYGARNSQRVSGAAASIVLLVVARSRVCRVTHTHLVTSHRLADCPTANSHCPCPAGGGTRQPWQACTACSAPGDASAGEQNAPRAAAVFPGKTRLSALTVARAQKRGQLEKTRRCPQRGRCCCS